MEHKILEKLNYDWPSLIPVVFSLSRVGRPIVRFVSKFIHAHSIINLS
jgi:hypothetical protein